MPKILFSKKVCEKLNSILDPNYYFFEKAENYEIFEKIENNHILVTLFLIYQNIKYIITNR